MKGHEDGGSERVNNFLPYTLITQLRNRYKIIPIQKARFVWDPLASLFPYQNFKLLIHMSYCISNWEIQDAP